MKNIINKFKNQDSFFSIAISAVFFLILALLSPYFFKSSNLLSLQAVIAPRVIIAIGMMVVLVIGMFDLSVGSIMGFSGIVCGYLLGHGNSIAVAVLAGLGTGILIGLPQWPVDCRWKYPAINRHNRHNVYLPRLCRDDHDQRPGHVTDRIPPRRFWILAIVHFWVCTTWSGSCCSCWSLSKWY